MCHIMNNLLYRLGLTIWMCVALLPASSYAGGDGLFYSTEEVALWKARAQQGPFLHSGDAWTGSPGEWDRMRSNADAFVLNPELPLTNAKDPSNAQVPKIGLKARDTAFAYLVTNDPAYGDAVRAWLLTIVDDPTNDITQLPVVYATLPDGSKNTLDGYFRHAMVVARLAMIYDFAKEAFSDGERTRVETWLLEAGLYFEKYTHSGGLNVGDINYGRAGLVANFPNRKNHDYRVRSTSAALDSTNPDVWGAKSNVFYLATTDTEITLDGFTYTITALGNGCGRFFGPQLGVYAYVHNDGTPGNRLSVLSQWYNNRRSDVVLAFGLIGVMLNNQSLIVEAKRYVKEWLRYSVWPDGSQGEYIRNGNYCAANAGLIYSSHNIQTAALLADVLGRRGDFELYQYNTVWGLYGSGVSETESSVPVGSPTKTIWSAIKTYLQLVDNEIDWYQYEALKSSQTPGTATHLDGIREFSQFGAGHAYHELSYLPSNRHYNSSFMRGVILRDPSGAHPPFPGTDGLTVDGGLEGWNGATSLFPGILFMFADSFVDLSVSLTATPSQMVLGSNVTYTATVTNNSPSSASSVTVSGLTGCTLSSNIIPSGGTASCTVSAAATTVGTNTQTVIVNGAEVDPNSTNNTGSVNTTVIAPDLTPTALSATKSGRMVYVSDTVRNQGDAPSGTFTVSYYLSTDTFYSANDLPLVSTYKGGAPCTRSIYSVVPGAASSVSNKICYKSGNTVNGQKYYVLVVADNLVNQVIESNETNNTRASNGMVVW